MMKLMNILLIVQTLQSEESLGCAKGRPNDRHPRRSHHPIPRPTRQSQRHDPSQPRER